MNNLLEIRDVSKGFPGVQALQGVTLTLSRGEVLALVGENGAGKSTLMKILSGIYTKDSGTIQVDGRDVDVNSPRAAQELGISIIHQEMNLLPHLTVAQNIYVGRDPKIGPFIKERALRNQTQELLDGLGITLRPNSLVGDLTVAQQQMVEIAKSLSFDSTKILIMDEPTSAISLSETQVLFRLILALRERGVGVVYISHRMEELRQIADRVSVLRDGQYVGTRDMDDITDAEIITMMVGREIAQHSEVRQQPRREASDVVLSVRGLTTQNLLRDVAFDLHKGEILGFAGLMGAGRTETARAIIGADPMKSGEIVINGKTRKITRPEIAVKYGIGYLPEDRKRHGLMLEQNVTFNLLMSALKRITNAFGFLQFRQATKITDTYIESLSIKTPSGKARVKNLSGGNQQKIVIAKWLARDCDILIFDEPTRGIDVGAKEEIYKLLQQLADQGKAVIVISSELPEVLRLSHRIVVMSAGRVTGQLDNLEADQERVMELAMKNIEKEVAV